MDSEEQQHTYPENRSNYYLGDFNVLGRLIKPQEGDPNPDFLSYLVHLKKGEVLIAHGMLSHHSFITHVSSRERFRELNKDAIITFYAVDKDEANKKLKYPIP